MEQKLPVQGSGENKMESMPVGRLLLNMALPLIAAMLVQALYNVVDSIFVARISESAVTALSLAFPIQNLQISFAVGTGVGVNALLSKSLGERNREMVSSAAGNGLLLMLINTALFLLFGIFGTVPYYHFQSSVEETIRGGIVYTSICCIGTLGLFVEILGERMLQSSGHSVHSMISQCVGAISNIILDPILIFGLCGLPPMGIAGAALATVLGQWLGAATAMFLNLRYNPEIHLSLKYLRPCKNAIKPILAVGIPSIIMIAIGSAATFGMNLILQGFQETATGVLGIYFKLQSFVFMPVFGLSNAAISVIAFNYGAKKPRRITQTMKLTCATCFCVMLLGFGVFQLFPQVLLGLFDPSPEFLKIGIRALKIISISFPMAALGLGLSSTFQALGNGIYATATSVSRQLIVLLPAAYLLSLSGEVGNVWWAFPIAELASLLLTVALFIRIWRKKIAPLLAA